MSHPPPQTAPSSSVESPGYAWYVSFVLMLCYAVSYMDRSVLNLLVIPIEHEFHLSDTIASLLIGAAFAISYAAAMLPIAKLSDRGDRRRLIAFGATFWCLSTIACAFVKTVSLLFVARICVATGEAVLVPAATSMLADYFSREMRARAMGLFSVGPYLGGGIALMAGGALSKSFAVHPLHLPVAGVLSPWRAVLLCLGLAGLAAVPVIWAVREPSRKIAATGLASPGTTFKQLFQASRSTLRALASHNFGFALMSLGLIALTTWTPTMLVRHHGWSLKEAGLRVGILAIIFGPLGALGGAKLSEWLAQRGRTDAPMLVGVFAGVLCFVASFASTLTPIWLVMAGLAVTQLFASFNYGVLHAALTELLPNHLRARGVAAFNVVTGIVSIAAGPALVALTTDHLFHDPGAIYLSLRMVVPTAFLLSSVILFLGLRSYRNATLAVAETRDRSAISA